LPEDLVEVLAVADAAAWRRQVRRPVVIGIMAVIAVLIIGGASAWAAEGSGASGYRTAAVARASIAQRLDVIGTVEPVNDASAAFQVGGQVTSVAVAPGDQVTAGETLATLDPTALSQTVSSDQSTVAADEAKLSEDEDSQSSGTGATSSTTTTTTPASSTRSQSGADPSAAQVTQDQATLVSDQKKESTDQQTEAADLTQAESVCTLPTTPPPTVTQLNGCSGALSLVSTDQQKVAIDQQTVTADENALSKALSAEQSSSSSTNSGSSSTGASTSAAQSSSSGAGSSGEANSGERSDASSSGSAASSASTDSAQQIATDEASIDSDQANLIEAQQALSATQLTSPIAGTIASVGIGVGDTVTAHSSTSDIVIIGTHSFEVTGTLTSSQVPSVKAGFSAQVAVDGTTGSFNGTVSQVGPVQSSSTGYSYPVVVVLPSSATGLFTGSTADMSIETSHVADVLAVPTSAVTTEGTRSYVLEMSSGSPVRKIVKVGIVGDIYTQVLSGLKSGDTVVLANLSQAVPASSTTVTGGFGGGGGGFGGGGGGFGGGGGRFSVSGAGAAGFAG
jgi:RND family efflux transporter MFP subunit